MPGPMAGLTPYNMPSNPWDFFGASAPGPVSAAGSVASGPSGPLGPAGGFNFTNQYGGPYNPSGKGIGSYDPSSPPGGPAGPYADLPGGASPSNQMLNLLRFMGLPELNYQIGARGPISNAFMSQFLTPGADFGQAATAAKGQLANLFQPGGEVANMIRGARGSRTQAGFGPGSSDDLINGILEQALQTGANTFAQGATSLEATRMGGLSSAFGGANQNVMDLINSLFTGEAGVQQYGLAKSSVPKQGLLGLGFGPF